MTLPAIENYDDEKLDELRVAVLTEQERRANLAAIPDLVGSLNDTYLAASGQVTGAEWRQPTAAFDAYPSGWQVTKDGKTWESLVPANVWEPPTNWREVTEPDGAPPDWVQPTGAGDAYAKGAQVTFEGAVFESAIDANTWSPTDYPAGWKKIV